MMACKTQVAEKFKVLDPNMLGIDCFRHALNLAIHDLIINFRWMKNTLSTSKKMGNLIKKLPQKKHKA